MDERTQAISFANSYFALVDGLASGLDHYMSEDVVLDWFGRTVKGRRNVTAFIETHKVNSRHVFPRIVPAAGIGYKLKHMNRPKTDCQENQTELTEKLLKNDCCDNSNVQTNEERFLEEPEVAKDINQNEIDTKGSRETDDMSYVLCEGDLGNLFKLEIASTNVEEIEQNINRIKLEEEMAPTVTTIKREECGQGDGPDVVEAAAIKYVEADGEIEFSRKCWKRDMWSAYITSAHNVHTWRRPCKLQIAYTVSTGQPALETCRRSKSVTTRTGQARTTRLPSLEEINEISNRLVPNKDNFGGFLREIDFFEDRDGFLDNLRTHMATKDPDTPLFAPRYVENKLVFNRPCVNTTIDKRQANRKRFIFNYQIHLIIYEGSNKCRTNLLREFERTQT